MEAVNPNYIYSFCTTQLSFGKFTKTGRGWTQQIAPTVSKCIRDDTATQKTNNKLGGRRPEGHVTDPRNKGWKRRAIDREELRKVSSERGQGPDGTVAP